MAGLSAAPLTPRIAILGLLAWGLLPLFVAIDLLLPLGFAAGLLYVVPVMLGLWLPDRRHPFAVAAVATVLIGVGYALSEPAVEAWLAGLNRVCAVAVLWATALIIYWQLRMREALRRSQARLQAIVDNAVDAIVSIDALGTIDAFNPAAERIFGYRADEVIGRNVSLLMPPPHREAHDGYLRDYLRTGNRRIIGIGREEEGVRKDGARFPLYLGVAETRVGGRVGFTAIIRDLTETKRVERRLREQATLAHLGEMAAVVAHEVRNPLAGISGGLRVIARRIPLDGPEREIVDDIRTRTESLNGMIQDILLFARKRELRLGPVAARAIVEEAVDQLALDPANSAVRFEVEGDAPPIRADAVQLQQVFFNLLLNAVQAIDHAGTVRVGIEQRDGACAVAITDSGPGIPEDMREKVFDPFVTTRTRGTGLGLAIAKRTIELHGGDIALDRPPEGGTTVRVTLGAAEAPAEAAYVG